MLATDIRIRQLHAIGDVEIRALSDVLIDCVEGGASVNFMLPFSRSRAEAFWNGIAESFSRGERLIFVAEDDNRTIVGTTQLVLKMPDNQQHRADLVKMLVHRKVRRRGVGAALLAAAEKTALEIGRYLLVLDTVAGAEGEKLYIQNGWQRCGQIPDFALWPDGRFCDAVILYKALR